MHLSVDSADVTLLCPGMEPSSPTTNSTQTPEVTLSTPADLSTTPPVCSTATSNTSKCSAPWALPPPQHWWLWASRVQCGGSWSPADFAVLSIWGIDALWGVWFAVQVEGCSPDGVGVHDMVNLGGCPISVPVILGRDPQILWHSPRFKGNNQSLVFCP